MKVMDFLKNLVGGYSKGKKTTSKGKHIGKSSRKTSRKPARETDVRKIYKTTDGYFTGNDSIKKPRRVAVIDQRKDDGALAVVKIYSKEGKKGKKFIKDLTLFPNEHSSLDKPSIVGSQVYVGVKKEGKYTPIFKGDFSSTNDKLSKKEHGVIKRKAGGSTQRNRRTSRKKIKRWKNHFEK